MSLSTSPLRLGLTLAALGLGLSAVLAQPPERRDEKLPALTKFAWTYNDAITQLTVQPRDPYLQYVALQTARRESRLEAAGEAVPRLVFDMPRNERIERRGRVDLFSIFTGALAVQESLQLDTMIGRNGITPETVKRAKEKVPLDRLKGPTIKSHPWEQMLAGKKPDLDPLARLVPEDFYFVQFRSVSKMLDLLDNGDLWSLHLFNQTAHEARTHQTGERIRGQLAIETNKLLRPFYDGFVEEMAVTGSDLFVNEGTDVTLIFKLKQTELFQKRMDGFLDNAVKAHADAKKSEGEIHGVKYVHVTAPERAVHVFSAYPEAGLHVRSNSKVALERVLLALKGRTPDGKEVKRLGDAPEFAFIRTLMQRGAKEEDGFIYLSDPFIRHLVGPRLKLTERRRMLAYNHLRMIGHAALLFRTDYGRWPRSLDEIGAGKCAPGAFNEGELTCPSGGKYSLSADGTAGVSSLFGRAHNLLPCCEIELKEVTGAEADEYQNFLTEYNRYWRTFFDPIAVRVQVTPKQYRLETIVLPLIDNSIYSGLHSVLGGKAEPLDALPVPRRNIFTAAGRFKKDAWLTRDVEKMEREFRFGLARELGIPDGEARKLDVYHFVKHGLGNQVGFHVYDSAPFLDLNLLQFLGELTGTFNGPGRGVDRGFDTMMLTFMAASVTAPVYLSFPVADEKIVEEFLGALDQTLALVVRQREPFGGWFRVDQDFYKAPLGKDGEMRGYGLSFGPVKWRFFWARIGKGLYVASKSAILEDLLAAEMARAEKGEKETTDVPAHALLRLRPRNWSQVLPDYRLAWVENARKASLNNLGPIQSAGRAVLAGRTDDAPKSPEALGKEALELANRLHAVKFYCPEGGQYLLSPEGKASSSIFGTPFAPKQPLAPGGRSSTARVMETLSEVSAALSFLEDGLHAVLTIERK